jgi:crossover junction endodeoxyribonuclease RuvC
MIILGIDPAINNTGYGVIAIKDGAMAYIDSGTIKTTPSQPLYLRLALIAKKMEEIIDKFTPCAIGMEEVFVNKNVESSIKLCHARGAIMATIGKYDVKFIEMSPSHIKKVLTGNGNADKIQVSYMIRLIIKNIRVNISHDESDALAVAYALSTK